MAPPGRFGPLQSLARLWSGFSPAFVLAIGLAATLTTAWLIDRILERQDRQRFQHEVAQAVQTIDDRMETYVALLRAGAGVFAAAEVEVDADAFRRFVDRLSLDEAYPGVQGLGYSRRLEGGATPRHAIVYLEPMDRRNQAAIGYDMYAHPVRRAAMARARDTGQPAASGRVELVQEIDEEKQAGFLIYMPVYFGLGVPGTPESRRERLHGFVYSPFRATDLLHSVFAGGEPKDLAFAVYDGPARPENLLHASSETPLTAGAARYVDARTIEVAGRPWTVVMASEPAFEAASNRRLGGLLVLLGVVGSGVLAAANWAQLRARVAAEREVAAREQAETRQKLLLDELNHRVKNTLATVQSIAAQTLRGPRDLGEARQEFEARLLGLSSTHDLLTRDGWRGANLRDLALAELSPYDAGAASRLDLDGPELWLPPNSAVALGMALHELATNAAKYGALSVSGGRVSVAWRLEPAGRLTLDWSERGGPPVVPPTRRGFGSRLILQGLAHQLQGEVTMDFAPEGVRCRIAMPAPTDVKPRDGSTVDRGEPDQRRFK